MSDQRSGSTLKSAPSFVSFNQRKHQYKHRFVTKICKCSFKGLF